MKCAMLATGLLLIATFDAVEAQAGFEAGAEASARATARAELPVAPVDRTEEEARAGSAAERMSTRAAAAARTRLEVAAAALHADRTPTEGEVRAGATALLAGAGPADLQRIRQSAPSERRLEASLTALAELSAQGADPARVSADIAALLTAGASDRAVGVGLETGITAAESALFGGAAGALDTSLGIGAGLDGLGGAAGLGASVIGGLGGF
ncbi:MAG: hypothetical protein WD766_02090 [Gemmatimonadota bacterium]